MKGDGWWRESCIIRVFNSSLSIQNRGSKKVVSCLVFLFEKSDTPTNDNCKCDCSAVQTAVCFACALLPHYFKFTNGTWYWGPCVRKLFTGLIMYLPSQNKKHCIVLVFTTSLTKIQNIVLFTIAYSRVNYVFDHPMDWPLLWVVIPVNLA